VDAFNSQWCRVSYTVDISGKEAYSSWEDVAEGRNFGPNDAMSSKYTHDDFPEVSSQEVLDSAARNRGNGGKFMFSACVHCCVKVHYFNHVYNTLVPPSVHVVSVCARCQFELL
jgi:hypothetical protein